MMALDDRGYGVGIGSFSSGLPSDPSAVLEAMGMPGTFPVRIGVGRDTREDDIDGLLSLLPGLVSELKKMEAASSDALSRLKGTTP
jgi:cysteine desulfurase